MRAVSLFSGAGGMDRGFDLAGIQTVLQAENDPWCLEVLARHWPDVERVTDVRSVSGERVRNSQVRPSRQHESRSDTGAPDAVDLVYGGFPCQDVSVAGNRAGLGGERSGLWSEFARIVSELQPRWVCIENVPGLLSSAAGRDFGTILSDLDDIGYGVAWAVLDARYFGVPQRRRRVFLVGCLGNPDAAAAVLAVCESCGGHPAQSRETGQGATAGADESIAGTLGSDHGNIRADQAWTGRLLAASLSAGGHPGSNMPGRHHEDDVNLVIEPEARALTARASGYRMDGETENFVVAGANSEWVSPLKGTSQDPLSGPMGVRRLTPLECERLMAWPDEWTKYTSDGREIPDSHRYRLCGNGVVSTVAQWIGLRMVAVNRMLA